MKIKKLISLLLSSLMIFFVSACGEKEEEKEIRVYTSFFGARGTEISKNNEIQQLIAEKTGAMCEETWLKEQEQTLSDTCPKNRR